MKKQLLSTSAIALGVAMASPAAAQSFQTGNGFDFNVGGFYRGFVGAADVGGNADGDFDGVSVFNDGEIYLRPSITLDSGLTFGLDLQIEAQNSRYVDESFLYIQGDQLGLIRIGQKNSAGYNSMVGAPTVTQGIGINSGTTSAFVPFAGNLGDTFFRQASGSSYTEVAGSNDTQRLTYFTPSFNGLVVGVSYTPEARGDRDRTFAFDRDEVGAVKDAFDIGVNYSQSFGTTDITLGARWGTGERNDFVGDLDPVDDADLLAVLANNGITDNSGDPTTWGIGATVGFGAFTFGGSYTENDTDYANGLGDQQGWSLGATYDLAGPWALEAGTYQGTVENGTGVSDSDLEQYKIGAAMTLAPGVQWNVFYLHSRSEDKLVGERVKGDVIGTGIALSF